MLEKNTLMAGYYIHLQEKGLGIPILSSFRPFDPIVVVLKGKTEKFPTPEGLPPSTQILWSKIIMINLSNTIEEENHK